MQMNIIEKNGSADTYIVYVEISRRRKLEFLIVKLRRNLNE